MGVIGLVTSHDDLHNLQHPDIPLADPLPESVLPRPASGSMMVPNPATGGLEMGKYLEPFRPDAQNMGDYDYIRDQHPNFTGQRNDAVASYNASHPASQGYAQQVSYSGETTPPTKTTPAKGHKK